jgi:hypothetical protein
VSYTLIQKFVVVAAAVAAATISTPQLQQSHIRKPSRKNSQTHRNTASFPKTTD